MKTIFRMALESCRSNCRWIVSIEMPRPGLGCVRGILGSCSVGPGQGSRVRGGSNEKYLQNGIGEL